MTMELCILEENEIEKWDSIVDSSPYGTIFHTWKFLKIIEKHTKTKLFPIIVYEGTKAIGIFPIFYQKKYFIKAVFSPPPHVAVPYLGPIIIDYDILRPFDREKIYLEFQKKIDDFLFQDLRSNYAMLVLPRNLLDARPFIWTNYDVRPLYNYTKNIIIGEEKLWNQFRKNLRQGITRTIKKGVTIEEGFESDIYFIHSSVNARYSEQNKKFSPTIDYLIELYKSLYPLQVKIFISKFNCNAIGGSIYLCYKDNFIDWLGGTKTSIEGLAANDLTTWESLKWAFKNKFIFYEQIGANTERLAKYKSKYDPEISICFSAKKYSSPFYKWLELCYKGLKRI